MIGLVVTGHGLFAEGMHSSAKMIAGDNEHIKYVCFEEGMGLEDLAVKLNAAYNELSDCDGIVVLSDLPGGSPFKTAVEVAMTQPDKKIEVVAGTNLPMIVTAVTMIEIEDDATALAEELMETGKECIVRFALAVREEEENEDEDGI